MIYLDYYKPADPPVPGPQDIRRMAVDAVADGLPVSLVARLFSLDAAELRALAAPRIGRPCSEAAADEDGETGPC